MSATALLPCPFCGGPPMLHSYHEAEGPSAVNRIFWVTCDMTRPGHCQAAVGIPVSNRQTEAQAIAAWNRRATTPARATTEARVAAIIREQSDPAWAARLICDLFEGAKA